MLKSKLRFVYMIMTGILFTLIAEIFRPHEAVGDNLILKMVFASVITIFIWEGNLRIDHVLNLNYPWLKDTRKRFFIQLLLLPGFTTATFFSLRFITHVLMNEQHINLPPHRFDPLFIPALFLAFLILAIDIGYQFLKAWKKSLLDIAQYRRESAEAQLNNLKNQINPHFLFNNLNVLTSLIYQNQDKAVAFIKELSNVYRYVLENKNAELVLLNEEITFLKNYIYLLKIRFENAILFSIEIEEHCKSKYLPPMCLQMLVENTIQHNEASQENPLHVKIYTANNRLTVENNIQLRYDHTESSRTGLKNIQTRYTYFTDKPVGILRNESIFSVNLPLLSS